jgi:hypothetical protein
MELLYIYSPIEVFKLLRKHGIRSTFYLIAKNVQNMRAKYSITNADLYIFDETGFMMGMITINGGYTCRTTWRGKDCPAW